MAKKKKKVKKKASKKAAVKKKAVKKKKTAKKAKAKKNKGGGQTKYRESHADRALTYAEVGCFSQSKLAKKFKVSANTLRSWIKGHKKFADAIAEGKKIAIEAVDSTYHEMALGLVKEKKGYLPPNQKACAGILAANVNKYKNKHEINLESETLADIIAKAGILKQ